MVMGMVMDTEMKKNRPLTVFGKNYLAIACLSAYSITTWSQQTVSGSALSTLPVAGDQTSQSQTKQPSLLDSQGDGQVQAFVIKPRIKLGETWSDNVDIGRTQNTKTSGLITEISPGIHIDARTARLRGYLDYSLLGLYYTEPSGYSRTQNALNTFGTFEAISNWAYLDFSAVIAQQAISAFGTQTPTSSYRNANSTETGTYRLSPYVRGRLGGSDVDYLLRYNWSTTQASANNVSDIDLSEWLGRVSGGTAFKNLRWSVDASQQTTEYSLGRKTEAERLYATATYQLIPQFRVSASGGQESNNYASAGQVSHNTSGYGFDWSPTERTQFSVFKERRFFGDGHRINFNHRFPLSTITFSDTRDVSVLPNQFSTVGAGTVYDLLYQTFMTQMAQDPRYIGNPALLAQDAAANTLLMLSTFGIPANAQLTSSFLTSRATVQRRQQLSFAMQGARNTLIFMINRNENESILANQSVNDDYLRNNTTGIRQTGFSINLAHRLSEQSSLNVLASRQNSDASGNSTLRTSTTLYQANFISKLGPKTSATVGVRRTEFDSPSNPYTENAILGSISVTY